MKDVRANVREEIRPVQMLNIHQGIEGTVDHYALGHVCCYLVHVRNMLILWNDISHGRNVMIFVLHTRSPCDREMIHSTSLGEVVHPLE